MHACIHSTSQSQLDVLGPKEATLERKELDEDTVVTQGTISPMKAGAALLCTLTISVRPFTGTRQVAEEPG